MHAITTLFDCLWWKDSMMEADSRTSTLKKGGVTGGEKEVGNFFQGWLQSHKKLY